MPTQKQVRDYVMGAINYPLLDEGHLVRMVCLHFPDLDVDTAQKMVTEATKNFRPGIIPKKEVAHSSPTSR